MHFYLSYDGKFYLNYSIGLEELISIFFCLSLKVEGLSFTLKSKTLADMPYHM